MALDGRVLILATRELVRWVENDDYPGPRGHGGFHAGAREGRVGSVFVVQYRREGWSSATLRANAASARVSKIAGHRFTRGADGKRLCKEGAPGRTLGKPRGGRQRPKRQDGVSTSLTSSYLPYIFVPRHLTLKKEQLPVLPRRETWTCGTQAKRNWKVQVS